MESDLKVSGNEAQQWEREMDPSSILNSWLDSRGKVSTFQFSLSLELMLFTLKHLPISAREPPKASFLLSLFLTQCFLLSIWNWVRRDKFKADGKFLYCSLYNSSSSTLPYRPSWKFLCCMADTWGVCLNKSFKPWLVAAILVVMLESIYLPVVWG